jgi:DNA-binding transcriptional MerR regulator
LEEFPLKPFYTIGEVSRLTGVPPHVLRYWESEKVLRPQRRTSRHRLYRPQDIQLIFEIKRLRDEEKLTLAAMRRQLNPQARGRGGLPPPPPPLAAPEHPALTLLRTLREELRELKALLE